MRSSHPEPNAGRLTGMVRRSTVIGVAVLILVAGTAAAWFARAPGPVDATGWHAAPEALRPVLWPEPRDPADFQLVTQTGERFTRDSFAGQWDLVFFGYLDCPDVCPTSLGAMRQMRRMLAERNVAGGATRFVLVSVDAASDNPEKMRRYLARFDQEFNGVPVGEFIGLTGAQGMIDRLAESLAVYHQKDSHSPGNFIDHTGSLMIIDPNGRAVGALQPPLLPERMVESFKQLVDNH